MTDIRWKDNPKLAALAGTERIPATSMGGGAKDGGGSVSAGADIHITPDQLRAAVGAPKIITTISSGTITPTADCDLVQPSALSAALTIANPSGTAVAGWGFVVDLIDNGTARGLTWGGDYASALGTLPTTTKANKRLRVGIEYNSSASKWQCMWVMEAA